MDIQFGMSTVASNGQIKEIHTRSVAVNTDDCPQHKFLPQAYPYFYPFPLFYGNSFFQCPCQPFFTAHCQYSEMKRCECPSFSSTPCHASVRCHNIGNSRDRSDSSITSSTSRTNSDKLKLVQKTDNELDEMKHSNSVSSRKSEGSCRQPATNDRHTYRGGMKDNDNYQNVGYGKREHISAEFLSKYDDNYLESNHSRGLDEIYTEGG